VAVIVYPPEVEVSTCGFDAINPVGLGEEMKFQVTVAAFAGANPSPTLNTLASASDISTLDFKIRIAHPLVAQSQLINSSITHKFKCHFTLVKQILLYN
jgi:hypothetical protein